MEMLLQGKEGRILSTTLLCKIFKDNEAIPETKIPRHRETCAAGERLEAQKMHIGL